jgi:phosphohistidine phosphatase SixA
VRLAGIGLALVLPLLQPTAPARARQEDAWTTLRDGGIAVLRHAAVNREHDAQTLLQAGSCEGRRWLSEVGQQQVDTVGERFRQEGVGVAKVLASPLCPARVTAEMLGLGSVEVHQTLLPAGDAAGSVWSTRGADALRRLVAEWRGPGALVLVTHLGNIAMLTGLATDPGGGFVLLPTESGLRMVGRLPLE